MARWGRVVTAMVTPFDKDLRLDLDAAVGLAKHLADNGSDGLVLSERLAYLLAPFVGRPEAQRRVGDAAARAVASGRSPAAELAEDDTVAAHLDAAALDHALDPAGYLGAATALVDRALELYDFDVRSEAG